MQSGDHVAVYDARACRWCRAQVISVNPSQSRATVAAHKWWAVIEIVPAWIRPVAVVRAS